MSEQGATAFWERIQSDEQFRVKIEQAATPGEKRELAAAAGYQVGPADLGTLRSLAGISEISDDDLEKIAGGGATTTGASAALGTTIAAASAAFI